MQASLALIEALRRWVRMTNVISQRPLVPRPWFGVGSVYCRFLMKSLAVEVGPEWHLAFEGSYLYPNPSSLADRRFEGLFWPHVHILRTSESAKECVRTREPTTSFSGGEKKGYGEHMEQSLWCTLKGCSEEISLCQTSYLHAFVGVKYLTI